MCQVLEQAGVAQVKCQLTTGCMLGKCSVMGAMISSKQKMSQEERWDNYLAWWKKEVRLSFQGRLMLNDEVQVRKGSSVMLPGTFHSRVRQGQHFVIR